MILDTTLVLALYVADTLYDVVDIVDGIVVMVNVGSTKHQNILATLSPLPPSVPAISVNVWI